MNILSRLKLMEKQLIGNDSEFCGCAGETRITVLVPTPDGKGKMIDGGGKPFTEQPEFCETCHKPIEKRRIIIQPYDGATKDRFPN